MNIYQQQQGGRHTQILADRQQGAGVLSDVNNWFKKNKFASKIQNVLKSTGLDNIVRANPYGKAATTGIDWLASKGYGPKKQKRAKKASKGKKKAGKRKKAAK